MSMSGFNFPYTSHIWCHFYFVSHSIPTSLLFGFPFHFDYRHTWKNPTGFSKIPPLKRRFPTFHYRTLSFFSHPFCFIRTLKIIENYWKVNFPFPENRQEPPSWNLTCYPLGHQYTLVLINLKHCISNLKPL